MIRKVCRLSGSDRCDRTIHSDIAIRSERISLSSVTEQDFRQRALTRGCGRGCGAAAGFCGCDCFGPCVPAARGAGGAAPAGCRSAAGAPEQDRPSARRVLASARSVSPAAGRAAEGRSGPSGSVCTAAGTAASAAGAVLRGRRSRIGIGQGEWLRPRAHRAARRARRPSSASSFFDCCSTARNASQLASAATSMLRLGASTGPFSAMVISGRVFGRSARSAHAEQGQPPFERGVGQVDAPAHGEIGALRAHRHIAQPCLPGIDGDRRLRPARRKARRSRARHPFGPAPCSRRSAGPDPPPASRHRRRRDRDAPRGRFRA